MNDVAKALSMHPPPSKRICTDDKNSITEYTNNNHESESPFDLLPLELFCYIILFIGNTPRTLLALVKVNQFFQSTLTTIGNAMLPRAYASFRVPLTLKSPTESSTSLFSRYTYIYRQVMADLLQLRTMFLLPTSIIYPDLVQHFLGIALALLRIGPTFSLVLEQNILSTCGKFGVKSFQYSKWALTQLVLIQWSPRTGMPSNIEPRWMEMNQVMGIKIQQHLYASHYILQRIALRKIEQSRQPPTLNIARQQPTLSITSDQPTLGIPLQPT